MMDKKIFVALVAALSSLGTQARSVSFTHVNDTIARDLSDLEAMLQDSVITEDIDTNYYGIARQRNFNALRFVLDKRHRFKGDNWKSKGFFDHSYIELGAGTGKFYDSNGYKFTPQTNLFLNFGKEVSPMSAFRIGVGGGATYLKANGNAGYKSSTVHWAARANFDFLYNFSNYILGYRPDRPLQVSGVIGLGVQHAKWEYPGDGARILNEAVESGTSFYGRTGLQLKFFAGSHSALTIEPYALLATDKFDLSSKVRNDKYDLSYGVNLSYIYYFNSVLSDYGGDLRRTYEEGQRYFSSDPAFKKKRSPFFFEYTIGPSWYKKVPMDMGDTQGYTVTANVGMWLSSAIGVRAGLNGTNDNWQQWGRKIGTITKGGISLDALLNPFGFRRNYNWDSQFGINFFGGYEWGRFRMSDLPKADMNKGKYIGYRFGAQIWTRLTNDLRFNIEPMYTLEENYMGRTAGRYRYDELAVKAGLTVLFRSPSKRDNYELNNSVLSKLFFGLGLGTNSSIYRFKYSDYNKHFLRNGMLLLGYKFNDIHAVRLMGEYFEDEILDGVNMNNLSRVTMRTSAISLDYQLDLLNAMAGIKPSRRWGVNIYAGPSFSFSGSRNPNQWGLNVGGQLSYRVARNISLFYSHTAYWLNNRYRKVSEQAHFLYGTLVNSFNLGLIYQFNSFSKDNGYVFPDGKKFFLEYGVGMGSHSGVPVKSGDSWGTSISAGFGLWFTPYLGARTSFEMQKGISMSEEIQSGEYTHTLYNQLGKGAGSIDLLINPLGFAKDYNFDKSFGVNLFVGYENGFYATSSLRKLTNFYKGNDMYYGGFHYGAQLWTKLTQDLRFYVQPTFGQFDTNGLFYNPETLELSYTNKVGYKKFELGNGFNIKAGLTMFLRTPKNREVTDPDDLFVEPYFYAGVGGGWNIPLQNRHYEGGGAKLNGILIGGYRFSPYSTLRASLEFVSDGIADRYAYRTKGISGYQFKYMKSQYNVGFLALDYQLDLFSVFTGYKATRKWDAQIYGGVAGAYAISSSSKDETGADMNRKFDSKPQVGLNAGLMTTFNFNSQWSAFFNHSIYGFMLSKGNYIFQSPSTLNRVTILNTFNFGIIRKF